MNTKDRRVLSDMLTQRDDAGQHIPGSRRTFVLIHGGWHGGWCWARIWERLEALGYRVYAPSLTGMGDRSHLLSTTIDLDTYISDIVNLFVWEDIEDTTLVAHSYAVWPVSAALEEIESRVSCVVFLDAFVPENGQAGIDLFSPASRKVNLELLARQVAGRPLADAASA